MASIFDGLGDVLTGIFGETVTVTPPGGAAVAIRGIFRDADVPVSTDDGVAVIDAVPTLKLSRGDIADHGLARGSVLELADGRRFGFLDKMDFGSPDPRGLVAVQLEAL